MRLTRAAEVASRLDWRDECGSTNSELRAEATRAPAEWPHLSVLLTDHQTAGRGRLDRIWTAARGDSLAVSVLLRDLPEDITERGWLPLAAGVAMTAAVQAQLPENSVALKWPNDVLVDGRKICGILAEVAGSAVIVGTGINTAMAAVDLPVPTATSFATVGVEADVDRLLGDYLTGLRDIVAALRDAGDADSSGLHAQATATSATLGEQVIVSLPDGSTLEGRATRLESDGRLVVAVGDVEHAVSAGDVVHARLR